MLRALANSLQDHGPLLRSQDLEAFYGLVEKGFVYRGSSRFTGASTTEPRWPRLR